MPHLSTVHNSTALLMALQLGINGDAKRFGSHADMPFDIYTLMYGFIVLSSATISKP